MQMVRQQITLLNGQMSPLKTTKSKKKKAKSASLKSLKVVNEVDVEESIGHDGLPKNEGENKEDQLRR